MKFLNLLKKIPITYWIIALLLAIGSVLYFNYKKINDDYKTSKENEKSLLTRLNNSEKSCVLYQTSIDNLEYYNDSITKKLLNYKKECSIKDKNIKSLEYMLSTYSKTDTICLHDTIFKDPEFKFDTTIGDEWVKTNLNMEYPNKISLDVSAKSEKEVIVHSHKETIGPPKKFFLCRWFQKKHIVTRIEINEENPHITSEQNVFIKIND